MLRHSFATRTTRGIFFVNVRATSLALSEFAELHVVHAWEAIGEGVMRSGFLGTDEEGVKAYVKAVERHHGENLHTH